MTTTFRQLMAIIAIATLSLASLEAQPAPVLVKETVKVAKPYRILTSGKQVTIKSSKDIKSVMVWTADGHRVIEQKDINAPSFNFRINVNAKVFFMMVQLADGKTYSEKLGVQ